MMRNNETVKAENDGHNWRLQVADLMRLESVNYLFEKCYIVLRVL